MAASLVAVRSLGLVTSAGFTAEATCAAIRAKVGNPTETRFADKEGEPILAHQVLLPRSLTGVSRLVRIARLSIEECLRDLPREQWSRLPVLVCVAEPTRPGRLPGLDGALLARLQQDFRVTFSADSGVIAAGRVSVAVALGHARRLIYNARHPEVLIVFADTLVHGDTLDFYDDEDRLLTPANSNGFMPGEGGGALLVGRPTGNRELVCAGFGFAIEHAHIGSDQPLRADGLTHAHKAALAEAGCRIEDVKFRVCDLAGEHYYFKEAALAWGRLWRAHLDDPDVWHPAETTGAAGAALGGVCVAVAHSAFVKGYAAGDHALLHFSDDAGQRASVVAFPG
jgi:3-oxoacyl-[acyl-carrier-protein] synthase-1